MSNYSENSGSCPLLFEVVKTSSQPKPHQQTEQVEAKLALPLPLTPVRPRQSETYLQTEDRVSVLKERVRQARWSFNLACAASAIVGMVGITLLVSGRVPDGAFTTTGGGSLSVIFFKLSKDANDRLDKMIDDD